MRLGTSSRAAVIFETSAMGGTKASDFRIAMWQGTYIENFSPVHDSVPLLAACWKTEWATQQLQTAMLGHTWDRYPERMLSAAQETPFVGVAESTKEAIQSAFASQTDLTWVASFDAACNYEVWEFSQHPAYGPSGTRKVIDFSPTPTHPAKIAKWLSSMNEPTRQIADRLQSTLRYHKHALVESTDFRNVDGGKEGSNG